MTQVGGSQADRRFEDYVVRDPSATPLPTALETHRVENDVRFRGGWIQVRTYSWAGPVEDVFAYQPDAYVVDLALSPRPAEARIAHLGLGQDGAPQPMGRAVVIPPASTIRSGSAGGRQRAMHCVLDRAVVEDILPAPPQWDACALRAAARLEGRAFEWLLLKMYGEVREERFGGEVMLEAFARALAVELARSLELAAPAPRTHSGGLAPWRLRRLRERVHAEAPAPSLAELADICGLTVRQLCRAFKAETGQTVGKFVEAAMAERARALLADGGKSVEEVAHLLGFAQASSFAVAFRRATGLRPSDLEGRRGSRCSRSP
jgi:AraC-like DNA-binding protein